MSAYIYAIIPYKSDATFDDNDPCIWCPNIPELDIDSEFAEQEGLCLYKDFLLINTCYRQTVFTDNKDGCCWLRNEIYQIAKTLKAAEVWYVEELITDIFDNPDFSFNEWVEKLRGEDSKYVAELTSELLKGNYVYSIYHDSYCDILLN